MVGAWFRVVDRIRGVAVGRRCGDGEELGYPDLLHPFEGEGSGRLRRGLEFTNTAPDGGQGETGRRGDRRESAPGQLQGFGGRPVPTEALVPIQAKGLVFPSKAFYDHWISHIESRTTPEKFIKLFLRNFLACNFSRSKV